VPERVHLLLTCEHAVNVVPRSFGSLFGEGRVLRGHRAFDIGALAVARHLSRTLRAPLFAGAVSRLLVDLNRSLHHRHVHSEFVAELDAPQRLAIVERYYVPHRQAVERHIAARVRRGVAVVHVAVHSFAPALAGEVRNADVGLLYDPARRRERELCRSWKAILAEEADLRVRFNYPYRGKADGLTTALRRRFGARAYAGIELEMNQRRLQTPGDRGALAAAVARSLRRLLRS
jgi:predicted N-formylglutamate amidohydrolase